MRNERKEIATKMRSSQRAVWCQAGCLPVDSLVVIWKLTARRNLSELPPERQAAGRWAQRRTVRRGYRSRKLKVKYQSSDKD